ncbi:heat repeat protein [Phlyctochytrium arcticum]|nr:heat repeat protein [Phlyctochytrium arcticum]
MTIRTMPIWRMARAAHSTLSQASSPASASPSSNPPRRRTGLQRDVLNLYRDLLRMVRTKPVETRPHFRQAITSQFRTQAASVEARDVSTIEFLLRKGRRMGEVLGDKSVVDIH